MKEKLEDERTEMGRCYNWRRNTQCVDPNMEEAEEENVKLGFAGSFFGAQAKKEVLGCSLFAFANTAR